MEEAQKACRGIAVLFL